ncbi:GIY-YIG nuclease family protein [candidate division WWE3 bacterium]|jgi:hypothetical protein|nr:GIY-YIG nuclease family protein [candidate division WWE3 bacterium]
MTKPISSIYLYVILSGNGLYKIGKSQNPKTRFNQINSGSPVECYFIFQKEYDENSKNLEKEYHDMFANKRIRGEWFDLDEKDVHKILEDDEDAKEFVSLAKSVGKISFYLSMAQH